MHDILQSIKKSLKNKNWYSALVLSLILPDICGKIEDNDKYSSVRYSEWFNNYLGKKYNGFLSGDDCYALRCSFLHEGSSNIEAQCAKDILDHFIFISDGAHCNKFSNCNFGDPKYDGKDFLQLSTQKFCEDMIEAVEQWRKKSPRNITNILKIHEDGFAIGNKLKIK